MVAQFYRDFVKYLIKYFYLNYSFPYSVIVLHTVFVCCRLLVNSKILNKMLKVRDPGHYLFVLIINRYLKLLYLF